MDTELPPMTPEQAIRFLTNTVIPIAENGPMRPVMLYGPPGIGKSAIPYAAAERSGRKLIEDRANTWDICDVRGALDVIDGPDGNRLTVWAQPNTFPKGSDGPTMFFVDEIAQAHPSIQTTLFGLTTPPYRIADYHLPKNCLMVLAGNRAKDRSAAHELPAALRNRFFNIEIVVSVDDWTQWALGAGIEIPVIAFIRWRPEFLHAFDAKQIASPTPRAWEIVSNALTAGIDADLELPVICGLVGRPVGTEFVSFLRIYRQLPSPDAVFQDPAGAPVPDDPSARYALATALAKKADADNFDQLTTYARRLPNEFGALMVRDAVAACPEVTHTRAYIEWTANQSREEAA